MGTGFLAPGEEMSPQERGAQTVQRDHRKRKLVKTSQVGKDHSGAECRMGHARPESPGRWVPPAPVKAVTVTMSLV